MNVQIVRTRAEFDKVMSCQWAGFAAPQEEFWSVWFPLDLEAHSTAWRGKRSLRPEAYSESADRLWDEHLSDPYSTWIYITDDSHGTSADSEGAECVASCQWRVYARPTNPFPDGVPEIQCAAWPVNSVGANFTRKLAKGIFTPRATTFAKPHVGLSWMAVRPEYRQQGLGSKMMQWGIDKADSLGLESYVEGSDLGKLLYEKHDFREICEFWLDTSPEEGFDREEWQAFNNHYLPRGFHVHAMWRPVQGRWEDFSDESWKEGFEFGTASGKKTDVEAAAVV